MRECLLGATRYEEFKQRTHDAYHLTERGADLLPVLHALAQWGDKYTAIPVGGGEMRVVHTTCGAETSSSDTRTSCLEPLTATTTGWLRSWRGDTVKELSVPSA